MPKRRSSDFGPGRAIPLSGLLLGALLLLSWAAPPLPPARTPIEFGHWLTVTPTESVLATLAGVLGWLCLCWLTVSALAVVFGRLPGLLGATCRAVDARITPLVLRRAVEGMLGTALVTGSLAAALPAGATGAPSPALAASISALREAGGSSGDSADSAPASASASSAPASASANSAPASASAQDGWPELDRPGGTLPTPVSGQPTQPQAARTLTAPVTVRPGDTLWGIAARTLSDSAPAATARAWPRWYTANRVVIGRDPDLLYPGQVLRPPLDTDRDRR